MIDPKMTEILGKIERRFRNNSGSLLALAAVLAATLANRPLPTMAEVDRWIEALGSPDAPKDLAQARAKTLLEVLSGGSGAAPAPVAARASNPRPVVRPSAASPRASKTAAKKRAAAPKRR